MDFDSTYRIVTPAEDRRRDVTDLLAMGFAEGTAAGDEQTVDAWLPWRFTRVAEEIATGRYRGDYGAFEMPTIVPGGARVLNLGLTIVAVHAGHRRRGILSHLIRDHFAVAKREGAIMSTLWAAEQAIYGRFGYGMIGECLELSVSRGVELAPVDGSDELAVEIETLEPDEHGPLIAHVAASMTRPGSARMDAEILHWYTREAVHARGEKEPRRIVVVRDGDDVVGVATFRRTPKHEGGIPGDVVHVGFHAALNPAAEHRLWSVLTSIDLSAKVETDMFTPDHPLLRLIGPHRGVVKHVYDGIWARLLDVEACMAARTYGADASVTFSLEDEVLPENAGVWRLTCDAGEGGRVQRVDIPDTEADVELTIQQLSSVYWGGVTVRSLHEAGQVAERRTGAVDELSRALQGDVLPGANFHF